MTLSDLKVILKVIAILCLTREVLDNPMNDSSPYFIQYDDFPMFADFYRINNIYQKSDLR